ncbi:hypothetical protein CRG98_018358 [Punica granatum]|uniref:Uncharacterized protein n=1 Tax=Punica granatum TaxID=22663 RepID=A0A2I0JY49_PUNGR|nr:hypothetical protein CRG98_018358 [Punica granatum]
MTNDTIVYMQKNLIGGFDQNHSSPSGSRSLEKITSGPNADLPPPFLSLSRREMGYQSLPKAPSPAIAHTYKGVAASGIAIFLQTWCIARTAPVLYAVFNPLGTVLATILAAIFLQEKVYAGSIAGAIAVEVGLFIVLWGKAKDMTSITNEENKLPPNLPEFTRRPN